MDSMFLLSVVAIIVLVVLILVVSHFQAQARIKKMRALAAHRGYRYAEGGMDIADRTAGFGLFSHGHTRKASNLLSTEVNGTSAMVMDYLYAIGYGKRRRIRRQSVLLLESERLDLPAFALRPEGLGEKVAADLLGQQDIDFDDQRQFSSTYVLQGSDESQIRALFSPEKLAFFARRPGLSIEGHGQRLLYYRAGKLLSPEAIPSLIEEGLAIIHILAGESRPSPTGEPDALAGLDEVLAEIGVEEG